MTALGAKAFARIEDFRDQIHREQQRTARLLAKASPTDAQALAELRLQHEELIAAEEVLREQLDELSRISLELESEKQRYADLFERAPDGYLVTDRFGVVHEANASAADLLGLPARFLKGKPIAALLAANQIDAMHRHLDRLDTERKVVIPLRLSPRGGGEISVVANVSLTGEQRRLLWVLRNETPPVDHELANVLTEKERLLAEERRLCIDLERSNRAKDRFIAVLSHDLRAPLNAILGWTQIVRESPLDSNSRTQALQTIERNARVQAKMIDELMDISRLAADRIQLELAPVDLAVVARRVVQGALPRAADTRVRLRVSGEGPVIIIGDASRLEQILNNLISNALKHTPADGEIDVLVRDEGRWASLIVVDTGPGIPESLIPHVFDLYAQEQTHGASGLGLGLYIVKRLVELHAGSVTAETDGGAKLTLRFPLRADLSAPLSEPGPPRSTEIRKLELATVLIVEDEADSRDLVALLLQRAGAKVSTVGTMAAALEALENTDALPKVIVSDLLLTDGSGFELVKAVRERNLDVRFIALSGLTTPDDVARARAAGFDLYLSKPLDGAQLIEAVHDLTTS